MSTETIYFKSYGSCSIECKKRMREYFACPIRRYTKKFTNLEEKKSLISKYDFPQVFEFYDSIKCMRILPTYTTYFSNHTKKKNQKFSPSI